MQALKSHYPQANSQDSRVITSEEWNNFKNGVAIIDVLLGSSTRSPKWSNLQRHIGFGQVCDLNDISKVDWPDIRSFILDSLYDESDPIPIEIDDLGSLVDAKPSGKIATELKWKSLSAEDFERLIFNLIEMSDGYINAQWLMKTNAADLGRDLSVTRVHNDILSGVSEKRIIIQCKHWVNRSINIKDIGTIEQQMVLWQPPKVDILIFATSGHFTSDVVKWIEDHNQSDKRLQIEMWPASRLEAILSSMPSLIAEYKLR